MGKQKINMCGSIWEITALNCGNSSVKYTTADTQILTTKSQILKAAVSAVSGLVSGSSLVETGALARL